jgi:hypothetical protein
MTHREKAETIYQQFYSISPLHIEEKRKADSKKQAIRAVEIIIEELEKINDGPVYTFNGELSTTITDWIPAYKKVITELENL